MCVLLEKYGKPGNRKIGRENTLKLRGVESACEGVFKPKDAKELEVVDDIEIVEIYIVKNEDDYYCQGKMRDSSDWDYNGRQKKGGYVQEKKKGQQP